MSDIFVSYAREDQAHAERLARALESRDWSVWWDGSIPTGKAFDEVIEEAIEEARCVVVLWSETSAASRWVRTEAEEGAKREILVPIRIEDVEIPLAFRGIQTADLIGWDGAPGAPEIEALVADIGALVDRPAAGKEGSGRPTELAAERPAELRAGRRAGAQAAWKAGAGSSRVFGYLFMAIAAVVVALGLIRLLERLEDPDLGVWPLVSFLVGLCVLWVCLWAYNETLSTTSTLLALFGLSFSIAFLGLPGAQAWLGKLVSVLTTLSLAFLVHFLMLYPKRSSLLDKFGFGAQQSLYFPVLVLALVYLLGPGYGDALQWVNLVVWVNYFAWALAYLILSFVRATSRERSQQGLSLMLVGVILGLLPPTVALCAQVFFPTIVLPGVEFYTLALVSIPITCAIAAVRGYKATVAAQRR